MSNFNLPPGCTMNDVDPPMSECPDCEGKGTVAGLRGRWDCDRCGGSGEVETAEIQNEKLWKKENP